MTADLKSIGLDFPRWQDAVEAAIASNRLQVAGEVRGGQLIQFADRSGAQIHILAVEPYATYAGFESITQTYAHVEMLTDVLALCEIIDPFGAEITTITCNLAQGPLLADQPRQDYQPLAVTALAMQTTIYPSAEDFENRTGEVLGVLISEGAQTVAAGTGAHTPDASAQFSARVLDAEYRTNELTGQRFIHATVDGPFPFDVCLPDSPELPARDQVIAGTALLTAAIKAPVGGGCGGCGGSCGCGGH
ncbi:hypothetical protein ACUY3K_09175 [Corynebacterium uberis]|uniref:hypothetical protein n=1 Tax=Corynebacterium TaxID=1716 RepID=UPI001D0AC5FA|nr:MULTISPECIES: hypothetical protein [Corynebacterium]MCZ9308491.1 hypothetical protein [Corynebacterium sp. c6VSa_13]UDL74150.1 hypothetical protein LH391_02700 [Corynebacterium uberis]UDL74967.1 hypothetical protein LH393_06705 [Corynebacterium uberis]UDL77182.1 hypothetical protein LH394_06695 [Corynebacterium uberis]UDL79464.1 hypothetical protein LH392_07110 [Corynebacterium uberis]